MSNAPIIMWFRKDLRLKDNPALYHAATGQEIIPVYIHDETHNAIRKSGAATKWWLYHALTSLQHDLKEKGADLFFYEGKAEEILTHIAKETGAQKVYFHEAFEQPQRAADKALKDALSEKNISLKWFEGRVLFHPDSIKTQGGEAYKVYSPFWRECLKHADKIEDLLPIPHSIKLAKNIPEGSALASFKFLPKIKWDDGLKKRWNVSEEAAEKTLSDFLQRHLKHYSKGRDFPAADHISHLSPYSHFGMISPRKIWHDVKSYVQTVENTSHNAADKFLSELGWREFGIYLLYHFPDMETKPFRKEFSAFDWKTESEDLEKWQQGKTGYPLVDAGMRELWQTGFMHNRIRMVVASFLVKHLQVHWKCGEEWFWDTLVDADYGNNIANWQWVAGCGADAAPYFRIFNPILQSKKFDEEAEYIRRYVPELAKLSNKDIHTPWEADMFALSDAGITLGKDYPHPIVDHDKARNAALAAYKEIK